MSGAMNLLLLLSAMLSALTGIGSSTRAPDAATAIAATVEVASSAAQAVIARVSRPAQSSPSLFEVADVSVAPTATIPARTEPLYASRRRE